MNWSRAKTIFIITFFLLNIFLGYQLNEKKGASNVNLLAEATLQERLSEMNISIAVDLHDEQLVGTFISGANDIDLESLIKKKQEVIKVDDEVVTVLLEQPVLIVEGEQVLQAQAKDFVVSHVVNGTEYRFSHFDKGKKSIYFFQTYEGKKVDNFESGRYPLVLYVDEQMYVIAYEQSYLSIQPIHPQGKEQEIISSIKAIEKLFNAQLIPPDSKINKVELSYYSFFKPHGEVQVFAPMWNIGVNETIYYVNAIDGAIQNIQ